MLRNSYTALSPAVPIEIAEFALYFLMSRFAARPSYWLSQAILHHLEILSERAGLEGDSEKKNLYTGLIPTWDFIASKLEVKTLLDSNSNSTN